jgi:Fe-S-cluster containining protein
MEEPFYKDGLNFECQRCSACCRHDPGYVFLSEIDVKDLSEKLKMSREDFFKKYCKKVDIGGFSRISLVEKANNDCIFWENGGCKVYTFRPLQCRTYPFWRPYLESEEDWNTLEASCPGVNKGNLHPRTEIEEKLNQRLNEPLIEDLN